MGQGSHASARSLDAIRARGVLRLCAHPNSLPFASKTGDPPGFQVELGRALASELSVTLETEWIVVPSQIFRADCDIVLDTIADPEAQADAGLQLSSPYYRAGVALAVPRGSGITSFADLNGRTKVGVQVGSLAAMMLDQRQVPTSPFGFEDDMLAALAANEVDAAAVTPLAAGYYNLMHPSQAFTIVPPDESLRDLVWNEAIGMRQPDDALRGAIDAALARLRADGIIDKIYARYGIALVPPR
ncbi:MAG TPA: transporter substrate-binding domain-containing protein [Stellaceae bacterium]|nr:transporter substrate-binding domain-containing protein [Stellaceae bacterium]